MTLLVAGLEADCAWIAADTMVSGHFVDTRARIGDIKVVPVQGNSLIGFSGDVATAKLAIREASGAPPGSAALDLLLAAHRRNPDVDFAYAYLGRERPRLIKVASGCATELPTLHLGEHDAFVELQRLRHSAADHPPDAMINFMCGATDASRSPDALSATIYAMQQVCLQRAGRGVGGIVTPYVLNSNGVHLCAYALSVSDPIVGALTYGQSIPHGTSARGGFGLSVTELRERDGIVAYWLQLPGGSVLIGGVDIVQHEFEGGPTLFRERVMATLGREVEVWFGDQPPPVPDSIEVIRDEQGRPRLSLARSGRVLSFGWVSESPEDFVAPTVIEMDMNHTTSADGDTAPTRLSITLQDQESAYVELVVDGEQKGRVAVNASELDRLIESFSRVRASMTPEVPREIPPGAILATYIDPAWRTRRSPHSAAPGLLMALRHRGLGWLSFQFPFHEARSLGTWLVGNSNQTQES